MSFLLDKCIFCKNKLTEYGIDYDKNLVCRVCPPYDEGNEYSARYGVCFSSRDGLVYAIVIRMANITVEFWTRRDYCSVFDGEKFVVRLYNLDIDWENFNSEAFLSKIKTYILFS